MLANVVRQMGQANQQKAFSNAVDQVHWEKKMRFGTLKDYSKNLKDQSPTYYGWSWENYEWIYSFKVLLAIVDSQQVADQASCVVVSA